MEIIIFKRGEIKNDYFRNEILFENKVIHKNECYGNFPDLDCTKCKIDLLDAKDEKYRQAAVKYLHVYELIKVICKKQVISRAYFKLYEIIYQEQSVFKENLDCFFICEAPGGFIECICDIRRKKNLKTNFVSISKKGTSINYDRYIEDSNLMHGDVTDINTIEQTIKIVLLKFKNGLDLITADGGFDITNYNIQEIVTSKLLLCEIYTAISTQKIGGMFIIKFFDMFCHNTIIYYLLLCSMYDFVKIIKPYTSRNSNSERYLVCYSFKGVNDELLNSLREIIVNFKISKTYETEITGTEVFPNVIVPLQLKNKLLTFNNLVLYEQIKTINESIKMIQNKDFYIQNLILKIFMDNRSNLERLRLLHEYKHILNYRINSCVKFLRNYNINIHRVN